MEAVSTSKTSVNFYQTTRRNNPEDSHLRKYEIMKLSMAIDRPYLQIMDKILFISKKLPDTVCDNA
jgi:hypothetical protein